MTDVEGEPVLDGGRTGTARGRPDGIAAVTNTAVYFYVWDQVGSVRVVTDGAGNLGGVGVRSLVLASLVLCSGGMVFVWIHERP